ncbi:cysteine--tRNA ligase [Desulfofalx alkaliphila]|uniref:cysteine--tRNA ligase n=1 Tax=Desulfofalx alkaliphila TaxID=105483 RepID=UPI0004E28D33|nr:cysteine--tRNA ligase [Desulfofalx alkaliphila]
MEVYNTLTRKKEKLETRKPGRVDMYVCGPTTYNYIHLGNARPIVVFDTVRRYLLYKGYEVTYIQNFTDVDDKIINRAREEGDDPILLAQRYIKEYFADADALNVKRADKHPKVSEHIPEIIQLIQKLISNGYAYNVDGDVYFNVRSYSDYGKLSGRSLDEMQAGARVEISEIKKDPMDFALWKKAKPGEPSWESPWGQGRPGWHIECSAMAHKYLGHGFDIHGGGYDLVFPHHENEIAQSEAASGQTFAKYWMHNGFITVNQEKMSKSLGNFFLVREILDKFSPETVRFYLLSTHYRSPLDFDDEKLAASERGMDRIKNSLRLLEEGLKAPEADGEATEDDRQFENKLVQLRQSFESAMDDDFNTALAIAVWFELAREVNGYLTKLQSGKSKQALELLEKAKELYGIFNGVLGVFKEDAATGQIVLDQSKSGGDDLTEKLLQLIIDVRQQARKNKDWQTADAIRDRLKELGITLEDTPQGVRWKRD